MKFLIAVDMEGITGVVHWDHVSSNHAEYARFRRLMTGDVNAAVRGAFEAGDDEVVVTDGHGGNKNVLIEELDGRARLNCGGPLAFSMVHGVQDGVDAVMLVGYHARVGTPNAILDHTWSGQVANVWLNGQPVGEIGLNAAVCGHFGAPVIMISGCQGACAEAVALLGEVEVAVVKRAGGRMAAECLPPQAAQEVISAAARRAVSRFKQGQSPRPFQPQPPISLVIEFTHSDMADRAAVLPNVQRNGRQIEAVADDMPTIYRLFRAINALA